MQKSVPPGGHPFLWNPLLDATIILLEGNLKAWQAYEVESARFIAKRMGATIEHLRALRQCCDVESANERQRTFFSEAQKDYAEEFGRLLATGYALSIGQISGLTKISEHRHVVTCDPAPRSDTEGPAGRPMPEAA